MAKRRDRLLTQARKLITQGGIEGLNLRTLAREAGVTVPTIYNLIGNKEAVVVALWREALAAIAERIETHSTAHPLEKAESVVNESIGVFGEDEDYYRAAFLAVEYLDQQTEHADAVAQLYAWAAQLTAEAHKACHEAGLLRARIPGQLSGEQILRAYRTSCRAWAMGQISIEEFRKAALTDVYMSLAADAVETFNTTLITKVAALNGTPSALTRERQRGER